MTKSHEMPLIYRQIDILDHSFNDSLTCLTRVITILNHDNRAEITNTFVWHGSV